MSYSQKLIEECKKTFKEEHNVVFSDKEAEEALDGLSGLFLAIADSRKHGEKDVDKYVDKTSF